MWQRRHSALLCLSSCWVLFGELSETALGPTQERYRLLMSQMSSYISCAFSDCKSPIRKADWQPDWVKESRPPSFISPSTTSGWDQQEMYGMNQTLYVTYSAPRKSVVHRGLTYRWGNTPAIDILNVQSNEGNSAVSDRDLALAFVGA